MAIYIVTGKLGGGKTLGAVSKIDEALAQGRMVATNLDLDLAQLPSVGRRAKNTRVIRVPDQPMVDDIRSIGFGIEGVNNLAEARRQYNEDRFGLLVLDECGTWLNSRDWQAEGRRELINFLLHIRKHLWDVYLIIQDVSMLDKQARKALAEHVVYCRRFDRISVPGLSFITDHLLGKRLSMPKLHMGIVKYGDQPNSMTVNRWWYKGQNLYRAYDTTQVFMDDYRHGLYSLLPPFYLHSKSLVKWNVRKVMQLTKIYFRKYSLSLLLASGVVAGSVLTTMFSGSAQATAPDAPEAAKPLLPDAALGSSAQSAPRAAPLLDRLKFGSIYSDGSAFELTFETTEGETYRPVELSALGIRINKTGQCRWRLDDDTTKRTRIITCYG